ncbi:SDR family NAD(P)-dependent oxidoreductase [Burkholderia glumae]|uniref:SDR family NAD(P)-dependent oxidoreductase n=1 Tax=Burkholderia glumae TaxID=337 RepID=UPI00129589A9|nr:SDR family oxidoreductase [Burkholderia glumae]MCM2551602.1 SDR family oxidoreductase [Burkholderia glumae]NVE25449.1 SDR family oxidoreductase [Burkholderia glumae]QGA39514.1 SDR family oxidoreductase [Burkholderia glumae]
MSETVVVSGGGTGIGLAAARYFARRGAQVVIVGRRETVLARAVDEIAQAAPGAPRVLPLRADLSEPAQVESLRDALVERFRTVDVLVNAAGGHVLRQRPASDYADGLAGVARRWTDNLRMNTLSAVLLTEALVPHLSKPGGRIVLVSSIAAFRGSGQGCYGASKAALHPYCADLAKALGPKGVTVNTVAPGFVVDTEFFGGALNERQRQDKIAEAVNGRAGTPDDIANTIGWLASPEALHITGQVIHVNGGAERAC